MIKARPLFPLIRFTICIAACLVSCAVVLPGSSFAHQLASRDKAGSSTSFSIEQLSPYVVASNNLSLTISTQAAHTQIRIDILSATNTRSELFGFADDLGDRRVRSSIEIPLESFTPDGSTPGLYRIDIPVNTPESQLKISTNGVYPVAISQLSDGQKTTTQYSFVTYVSSVSQNNAAYAYKLNVVPLVQYSPLVDRTQLFDAPTHLSRYGLEKEEDFLNAQIALQSINSLAPHGVVLSPETFDTYSYIARANNSEFTQPHFFNLPVSGSLSENITDTYSPLNLAELEKIRSTSQYASQLTTGRSIITSAGFTSASRTLVTESVTRDTIDDIARTGIDNIIVNESSFPKDGKPTSRPARITSGESTLRVASYDNSITEHLSSDLSASAQANYLIAATSVVTLEAPSVQRSIVLPLSLEELDVVTLQQLFASNLSSPLTQFMNPQSFFGQEVDTSMTRKLERADLGFTRTHQLSTEDIATIDRLATGAWNMFGDTSELGLQAFWMRRVTYSSTRRSTESIVNVAKANSLIEQIEKHVALPEKRTLTITSRENSIPVTIRNTSGESGEVFVVLSSDKLAFPKGTRFKAVLDQENTTIRVPVRARTSGSFPITITVVTPGEPIQITRQNATVRSTAVSGMGVAIAVASTMFLALWWISHARRTRKKPIAPVIELPHENAG